MDGAFTLLRFREPSHQDLVFAANAAGGIFLEKEDELHRYAHIFELLRSSALPRQESFDMIAKVAKEP
jgi:hypothetical protein